jgi:hypothetical protein
MSQLYFLYSVFYFRICIILFLSHLVFLTNSPMILAEAHEGIVGGNDAEGKQRKISYAQGYGGLPSIRM